MEYNNYKVRLVPATSLSAAPEIIRSSTVTFEVTPQISEDGAVTYKPITPIHSPGSLQVYQSTESRTFTIQATLVSRNVADALQNMKHLQQLRSWRFPYFGATDTLTEWNREARRAQQSTNQQLSADASADLAVQRVQERGVQLKGAPPELLYLYAYSNTAIDARQSRYEPTTPLNINRVPVVLTMLGIQYPTDVDYIPVYDTEIFSRPPSDAQPFPVVVNVSITLAETHSPADFERFDLLAYRAGNLGSF